MPAIGTEPERAGPRVRATSAWFKLAVLYLIAGVALGITMAGSQNLTLKPVHAHLNLLGFAIASLAGLIYTVFPKAGASPLSRVHFWLHNIGVMVGMAALALALLGIVVLEPVLIGAQMLLGIGVLVFAWNVFANVDSSLPR